ncbi:MAG: hypothetical protein QW802_04960 [Candidatus Altiarchaeota archaeon]
MTLQKSEKKEFKFPVEPKIIFAVALVIAVILFVIFVLPMLSKEKEKPIEAKKLTDAQILSITSREPITKDFVARNPKYETKITFVDATMLKSLAATAPAIYGGLNVRALYKVEYKARDEGILLLLDPETQKILKYYRVKEISF